MSQYSYLAVCAVLAVFLLILATRWVPTLCSKHLLQTKQERIFLVLAAVFGIAVIYGNFFLGKSYYAYLDAGSDTLDVYVPFYINLLDSVRNATLSTWNFEYGLGSGITSVQSWLFDPFNLLLIPLGLLLGNSRMSLVLVIVQAVKILLCALLFDMLLKRFCKTPLARIVGSLSYAFSGFLLLWGQHYWIGGVFVLQILVLIMLERLMDKLTILNFLGVMLSSAVCVAWSVYCAFMILFFAAVYSLFRLIYRAGKAHWARDVLLGTIKLLIPVTCGCFLACISFVPYAYYLLGDTERVVSSANQSSLPERVSAFLTYFVPLNWISMLLSRFLGNGLVMTGGVYPSGLLSETAFFSDFNVYEFPCLGFGVLSMVLLFQFFHYTWTQTNAKTKGLVCAGTILCILYLINGFFPALLNLFVVVRYRSVFILATPVCIACAIAWENCLQAKKIARLPLFAGLFVSAAVLVWSGVHTIDGAYLSVLYGLCLVGFAVCALLQQHKLLGIPLCMPVLIAAAFFVFLGLFADGFFVVNMRNVSTKDNFSKANTYTDADTTAALAYIKEIDSSLYRIDKLYSDWNLYNDSLMQHYMGISSYNSTVDSDIKEFFEQFYPFAQTSVGSCQRLADDGLNWASLASNLGVKYLLSKDVYDSDSLKELAAFGDVIVYENLDANSFVFGMSFAVSESEISALTDADTKREVLQKAIVVPDKLDLGYSFGDASGSQTIEADLVLAKNAHIEGTLSASCDTLACLLLPHTAGWIVTVDGKAVDTFSANFGFIGFTLTEGTHSFEAYFKLPGLELGAACSVCGAVGFGLAVCIIRQKNRKQICYSKAASIL